jgi:hypothetical protein
MEGALFVFALVKRPHTVPFKQHYRGIYTTVRKIYDLVLNLNVVSLLAVEDVSISFFCLRRTLESERPYV